MKIRLHGVISLPSSTLSVFEDLVVGLVPDIS